jgi:eukaryotic-like serine/threonine-protein kinase
MNKNQLGKYRLVAELARGGMGIVWLAELRGPGGFAKPCVVKELLPELAREPHHRAMFLDEASLAARLNHRNIVQTNEVGCEDGRWFMALELLEGCTLRRAATLLGDKLPSALAVRIVCEVLTALDYAHQLKNRDDDRPLGIVHRDVTPQNVFLTCDGQVKLLDFGIAKSRARREKTQQGFAKGCIAYMSPDHVATTPIDRRADLFSIGIVLRELLSGRRLWNDDDAPNSIVCRLIASEIPPFDDTSVPAALRAICDKAMAPRRAERWQSAGAMREALEAWLVAHAEEPLSLDHTLRAMFDTGGLAVEGVRVKLSRKRGLDPKPPPPVVLPPTELQTDPDVPRIAAGARPRWRKRELYPLVMAIVASVAAVVSVAGSAIDEDPAPIQVQVVSATPTP